MRGCSFRSSPAPNGTERTNPITAEGIGVQAGPGLAKHWQMTLRDKGQRTQGASRQEWAEETCTGLRISSPQCCVPQAVHQSPRCSSIRNSSPTYPRPCRAGTGAKVTQLRALKS